MKRRGFLRSASAAVVAVALVWGNPAAGFAYADRKRWHAGGPGSPGQEKWSVLAAVTYENLSVFPVVARQTVDTSGFTTLDEALASGDVLVSERGSDILRRTRDGRALPVQGGSASVNQLVLINRGSKPLLLLSGEVVSGGKQDRIIAKDRIVRPGSEPLPLDVFCVEHGRWSGASMQFSAATLMVHPSVREKAAVDKKQDEVWAAVRSGTTSTTGSGGGVGGGIAAGKAAPEAAPPITAQTLQSVITVEAQSESYDKIYNRSRVGKSVDAFTAEISRRFEKATAGLKGEHVIGVVVAYGGEVAWGDVFASEQFFRVYWPKLLKSYVVEALARPRSIERASLDDAREFLEPLAGRENIESEPRVYRLRQVTEGRYSEIEITALAPKTVALHWVKIHRTS